MTVIESIQKSAEFLAKKRVDSPRLHAELLLAHVLKMPRMRLYLEFERVLSSAETDSLRGLVSRRGQREPLQHIVGSTSFCGLEIEVNRHVLVPRPETELLAEEGWKFLNEQSAVGRAPSALDLGTGSGCIAIALAAKCPTARIFATDISPDALAVAKQNAARHHVGDRIEFLSGDGFPATPELRAVDLLISNPPYIPSAEIKSLEPEVREHDPCVALDGGADGLDFFRRIVAESGRLLDANGRVMVEFGDGQAESVRSIFESQNWIVEAIREDYTHQQRILIAKSSSSSPSTLSA